VTGLGYKGVPWVVQPFDLDTGESDTQDRLAALRTKVCLEHAGSLEFVEVADVEEAVGDGDSSPPEEPTGDYIPRLGPGPSFMDRKLQHLQVQHTDIWTLRDPMSAAARPKRWGVSRQVKGQEFNPTKVELSTILT
jgi:hypothetical protein